MNSKVKYHLSAYGDVFLKSCSGASPFSPMVLRLVNCAELRLFNLEAPVTNHDYFEEKAVSFRIDPEKLIWLRSTDRNFVVNLANNHMFDCGLIGLKDTIKHIQSLQIGYVGVVENLTSQEPYWAQLTCGRLAILGYTVGGRKVNNIGVAALDVSQVVEDINNARSNGAKWIILKLHWGLEYVPFPSPLQQRMARLFIDAGANVIIGSHPHVIQGIERYKNGVIFYSLGNFNLHTIFDEDHPYTDWGMITLINLNHKCIEFKVIPVKIDFDYCPQPMATVEQIEFHKHLSVISACLKSNISSIFWLKHASVPYFRSNLNGFRVRIRRYGLAHLLEMMKWLIHPNTYPYYLGLLLKLGLILKRGQSITKKQPDSN